VPLPGSEQGPRSAATDGRAFVRRHKGEFEVEVERGSLADISHTDFHVEAATDDVRWITGQVIDSEVGFRRWAS